MTSLLLEDEDEVRRAPSLPRQALSLLLHTLLALAAWIGLMLAGYALNPPERAAELDPAAFIRGAAAGGACDEPLQSG